MRLTLSAIDAFVKTELTPAATLADSGKEYVRVYLLPKGSVQISRVFTIMQRLPEGVREWGLTQTSLNEVFLRIVEEQEGAA